MPADANNNPKQPRDVAEKRGANSRPDGGEAFIPDPTDTGAPVSANDAEFFAEEYLASATTGEPLHMEALDEVVDEEEGGPFVELEGEGEEGEEREGVEVEGEGKPATEATEEEASPTRRMPVRRSIPR